LLAAERLHAAGEWHDGWPAPPAGCRYRGIERMAGDVRRAQTALGSQGPVAPDSRAQVTAGDICTANFGNADVVVILDVLHYLEADMQVAVLRRVRHALSPGGKLLLRIGDAGGGLRFRLSNWVDRTVLWLRGAGPTPLHCRPLTEWLALLTELEFDTTAMPMSTHTPFANVLLLACAR
jgi:SAM-dependent methyltransferase